MPLIELRDVSKTYDLGEVRVHALRSTSLSIERGEYVALLGPSGSGKSTLMNTLGCLDRPTKGSYRLDGEEIANMSRNARASIRNRHIGFVFQNFNLLARTSAIDNVELPLLYGPALAAGKRRKCAREMLEMVGLGSRLDHHPDLYNVYNRVTLRVQTHDAGGLTAIDFAFARAVNSLGR